MRSVVGYSCLLVLMGCADLHAVHADLADSGVAQPSAAETVPAEERRWQQLRRAVSRSSAELVPDKRADGITQVRLNKGFKSVSVLVRDASGRVQRECIDHPAAADRLFGRRP